MEFFAIHETKSKGIKRHSFGMNKDKAFQYYIHHSNDVLWYGDDKGYEDNFRFSWITNYGSLKTEEEAKQAFNKFVENVNNMQDVPVSNQETKEILGKQFKR
jgi:hypothetical protein